MRPLAPVILVTTYDDFLPRLPLLELVRPRAHRCSVGWIVVEIFAEFFQDRIVHRFGIADLLERVVIENALRIIDMFWDRDYIRGERCIVKPVGLSHPETDLIPARDLHAGE